MTDCSSKHPSPLLNMSPKSLHTFWSCADQSLSRILGKIPGSESGFGSSPKCNRLLLVSLPIPLQNWLSLKSLHHFVSHLVPALLRIRDWSRDSDHHENVIHYCQCHFLSLKKIHSNPFISFWLTLFPTYPEYWEKKNHRMGSVIPSQPKSNQMLWLPPPLLEKWSQSLHNCLSYAVHR